MFEWFTARLGRADRRLREWHEAWTAAAAEPDARLARSLRDRLDALALPEEEIEVEREMIDALHAVIDLAADVGASGLPVIATGHRIVGTDVCHFTAPASMPDEPSQPSGRLLLTSRRAIFVGGRGVIVAWHAVGQAVHANRDLLLVRHGSATLYRFQCNTFSDAICAAFLARRLAAARRPRTGPV